jgi:hypothetical protein
MGDFAYLVLVIVGWVMLQRVLLPKLGVPT